MADEPDPVDERIIQLLQHDGRRPFTQIATEIGSARRPSMPAPTASSDAESCRSWA
ncbi:MAG: AsnC family transcriptional regulator [Candidatus Limnocylindrales bacterium]